MTDVSLQLPDVGEPEKDIAFDMAKRMLVVAPLALVICTAVWGWDGFLSCAYPLALVLANFLLSAFIMSTTARISAAALMGGVLFGYVLRLGLITAAVLAVTGTDWFEPIPLSFTLILTHLGLLAWETRYVSASLAYPGLKPTADAGRNETADAGHDTTSTFVTSSEKE